MELCDVFADVTTPEISESEEENNQVKFTSTKKKLNLFLFSFSHVQFYLQEAINSNLSVENANRVRQLLEARVMFFSFSKL